MPGGDSRPAWALHSAVHRRSGKMLSEHSSWCTALVSHPVGIEPVRQCSSTLSRGVSTAIQTSGREVNLHVFERNMARIEPAH
jgi:hypothetical protein